MAVASEMIVLVDEKDRVVGAEEKLKTHQLGLLHRAFSVCIFRHGAEDVQFLLQRRQESKYHCGGLWTNTCCSHPRENEDVIAAGSRRLEEEMGFSVPLEDVGSFIYRAEFDNGLTEYELDHVLVGFTEEQTFDVNSDEVSDYKWMNIKDLLGELENNPENYTPWFLPALEMAFSHIGLTT